MKLQLLALPLLFISSAYAQTSQTITKQDLVKAANNKQPITSNLTKPKVEKNDTIITKDATEIGTSFYKVTTPNGTLLTQGKLIKGKREGIWRFYYEHGAPLKIEEYHHDKRNGMAVSYDRTGFATTDETYKNDLLDGISIRFINGGKIKSQINYKAGKVNGKKIMNYDDASGKQEESEWKDGKKNGRTKWYYRKNIMMMEADYKDDILNGEQITYNEKGIMVKKGHYIMGKEDGEWFEYDSETGAITKTTIYKNGELISSK
ncbi:MAG: hypothetical protein RL708_2702 [Bacteroidota bacterium]|jgi:antitoxin component YwqK of YwqJK toxin-antitoxin module